MKSKIVFELRYLAKNMVGTLGFLFIVIIFTGVLSQTMVPVTAALSAMLPLLYFLTLGSSDEINRWQEYQLTLPITRMGMVISRLVVVIATGVSVVIAAALCSLLILAATMLAPSFPAMESLTLESNPIDLIWICGLIGSAFALVIIAISLPFLAKFGMTRAVRYIPIAFALLFLLAMVLGNEGGLLSAYASNLTWWVATDEHARVILLAGLVGFVFILNIISLAISISLFKKREF